jgi:hypothetical protein
MEDFFADPQVERLPPEAVRIHRMQAEPNPDGRRIRVSLEMTPFLKRPELEVSLLDPSGDLCATASILEPMNWKLEFTLHIRTLQPTPGTHTLTILLLYPDLGEVDRQQVILEIPPASQP